MEFSDNKERAEIIKELREPNPDIERLVNKYFPGWIVSSGGKYSSDYPRLQQNWESLCARAGTTPKKIVTVSSINIDQNHHIMSNVCNFATRLGYCIRHSQDIIFCETCGCALPTETSWNILGESGLPRTAVWSPKCSGC
jgi:hypothetical protein